MIQVRTTAESHYDVKSTSLTNCSCLRKELICSTLVYNAPRELYGRNSVYVDHTCIWFPWCSIQVDLLNSIQPIHVDSVVNFQTFLVWQDLKTGQNLQTGTSECGHEHDMFMSLPPMNAKNLFFSITAGRVWVSPPLNLQLAIAFIDPNHLSKFWG